MFELKITITLILSLICFGWGIYLHRLDVPTKTTKIVTWLIALAILLLFLWNVDAIAGDRIIHYDKNQNRIGVSIVEGNRESHFSISGERQGYSIHSESKTEHYDSEWNRQGVDRFEFNDEKEEEEN